jgi:chromosome segregation ATPase
MTDIFDDYPEYTLDDIDKKIDVLEELIIEFSEYIESSKDTLDDIENKLISLNTNIEEIELKVNNLIINLNSINNEIDLIKKLMILNSTSGNSNEVHSNLNVLYLEKDYYNNELNILVKHKNRLNITKNKLIQSASNLLRLLDIKLNHIRNYKLD